MPFRHPRHNRARLLAGLMTLLVASLLALTAPSAQAVAGSPPVTAPDSAGTIYVGGAAVIDPLVNDSDPDGDELVICRVGEDTPRGIRLESSFTGDNTMLIRAGNRAQPGTYTLTYYACDFSYLTVGTITVTVEKAPNIEVQAIASRPGFIRVSNPADFAIVMVYGSFNTDDGPDGSVLIGAGKAKIVRVHRTVIDYFISDRKGAKFSAGGHVRGIKLPTGDGPQNIRHPNSRTTAAWPAR